MSFSVFQHFSLCFCEDRWDYDPRIFVLVATCARGLVHSDTRSERTAPVTWKTGLRCGPMPVLCTAQANSLLSTYWNTLA